MIETTPIADYLFSDHSPVLCQLQVGRPSWKKSRISYRNTKSINLDALREDLSNSNLNIDIMLLIDLNQLAISYDNTLSSVLEDHAPLITRTITKRPTVPWFNNDVNNTKRARRQAERKWRRTRLHTDFQQYKAKKNQATNTMNQARTEFYKDIIHEDGNDQRKLFKSAKRLFKQKADLSFPDHRDPLHLPMTSDNSSYRRLSAYVLSL